LEIANRSTTTVLDLFQFLVVVVQCGNIIPVLREISSFRRPVSLLRL